MKWIVRLGWSLLVIGITIYTVRAFDSRNQPELRPEHRISIEGDYRAGQAISWGEYQALEQDLVRQVAAELASHYGDQPSLNRHAHQSVNNPRNQVADFNLSYEVAPATQTGAAVLVHGLTDSPYSMRTTAEQLAAEGLHVFAPRLPGHGLAVGQVRSTQHEDWLAVTVMAMQAADQQREPDQPLILGGYSTGGALALLYAQLCQEDTTLPCPDRIILMSPAIGVSAFGIAAKLHNAVSWMPYFERFQYESVMPEADPFKYMSFSKNSAWEVTELTWVLQDTIDDLGHTFPPILAFQSVIDTTIRASALWNLMAATPPNNHHLVIYDVNRNTTIESWFRHDFHTTEFLRERAPLPFSLSVVTNASESTDEVHQLSIEEGGTEYTANALALAWPPGVYSASHVSLPFAPDDPLYGSEGSAMSATEPKGEPAIMRVPSGYFLRLRYNPFMGFQGEMVRLWVRGLWGGGDDGPAHGE